MAETSSPEPESPDLQKRRRAALWWTLGGVAAAVMLYAGYWAVLAGWLEDRARAWIAAQARSGIDIRHGAVSRGGFPAVVRVTFESPVIAKERTSLLAVWQGARAAVSLAPWKPWAIRVSLGGDQHVETVRGGAKTTWRGHAERLDITVGGIGSGAPALRLDAGKLALNSGTGKGARRVALARGRIDVTQPRPAHPNEKTPTLVWSASLEGLRLPATTALPLGDTFSRLDFRGRILGPLPKRIHAVSLLAWRDAGGVIEVERFAARYGPLDLETDGTLALDEELQPVGAFTARVQGFAETVAALKDKGLIKPDAAFTAHLVLGALAKTPAGGGRPRLDVAVSVQKRKIYLGPVALAALPFIRWPQPPPATP